MNGSTNTTGADTIFYNGHVYTADKNNSVSEAIAIKDGYVAAAGPNDKIRRLAGAATRQIDLAGKMAMPGLIDSHMRPLRGGKSLARPSPDHEPPGVEETLDGVQRALHAQGVTAILAARALAGELDGFAALRAQGRLALRVAAAVEIPPQDIAGPGGVERACARVLALKKKYAPAPWSSPRPDMAVTHAEFFIDGMLPDKTAYLLEPYFENTGSGASPVLRQTDYYAHPYYTQAQLEALFIQAARLGLDPHMRVTGDAAAEIALNAIAKMREACPGGDIRPAMARNDLTAPHQYKRFKRLNVVAGLSYQSCAMPQNMRPLFLNVTGGERFHRDLKTHGKFFDAGVRVAYNSDWTDGPLNEWYNLQCGLTRRVSASDPRLDSDRDLTVTEVLRSATIDAAHALHHDALTGSLEPGKFADLIVLDRNVFEIPADTLAQTKVLRTMIGGETVFQG
jgi:predicted amidohydrolase YtcJ